MLIKIVKKINFSAKSLPISSHPCHPPPLTKFNLSTKEKGRVENENEITFSFPLPQSCQSKNIDPSEQIKVSQKCLSPPLLPRFTILFTSGVLTTLQSVSV